MKGHKYTEKEKQFLVEFAPNYYYEELTKLFNDKFNTNVTLLGIQQQCSKILKIRAKSQKHRYSKVEKQFLIDNIENHTYQELTDMFNERFGTNLSRDSISDICIKRMKIKRNCNTGLFTHGPKPQYKIGDEINKDGYIWIKYKNEYDKDLSHNEMYKKNWLPKHRYVYENHYGKIDDKKIIIFLDGNRLNFEIENLYCIDRKINAVMNQNKWFTSDRELTLTAIKWCELLYALK